MRGEFRDQGGLFSYIDPESRIPADHPLRQVPGLVRRSRRIEPRLEPGFIRRKAAWVPPSDSSAPAAAVLGGLR